jgi:hypothetical protein
MVAIGAYWFTRTRESSGELTQSTNLDPNVDPLVAEAERELRLAELSAKKALLEAERAESEARKRRADLDAKQADEAKAQTAVADTRRAVEAAVAKSNSAEVSAAERTKALAEAAALAEQNREAQRIADAKAAETNAARRLEEKARADAEALKNRQTEVAAAVARTVEVARVATQGAVERVASGEPAPTTLSFPKWTLSSGGCGAGQLTVTGMARFSIEATPDGILVTEDFRGSGNGFKVVVTGSAKFPKEQRRYDIPTSGEWIGTKVFKSSGVDRVNTIDGKTPRTANVMKIQSVCP